MNPLNSLKNASPQSKKTIIIIVVSLVALVVVALFIARRFSLVSEEVDERERSIQTQIEELVRMRDERRREGAEIPPGREEIRLQLEVLGDI